MKAKGSALILIALLALTAVPATGADHVVTLVCTGTLVRTRESVTRTQVSRTIVINLTTHEITATDFGGPYPITILDDTQVHFFEKVEYGTIVSGDIDRISGAASMLQYWKGGIDDYTLTCRAGQRVF